MSSVRVDAAASVARILDAARAVFARGDGTGTLSRIAKEAGVGIATLYRHFPNRDALALAVYDQVFAREIQPLFDELDRTDAPRTVLLDMAERLLDLMDRERGLALSLGNIGTATRALMEHNMDAIRRAVDRAHAAHTLRADVSADDIPQLMTIITAGFGSVPPGPERRRYLNLLLDSLAPAHTPTLPTS